MASGGAETASEWPGLPSAPEAWTKRDEKPFDFHRKRQSVLLQPRQAGVAAQLITKGALARVLEVCSLARRADGSLLPLADLESGIVALAQERARLGQRVLGVASRRHPPGEIGADSERAMTFEGLLVLADPLKAGIATTVAELAGLGVRLKIITGDSAPVAERIAREAGLADPRVLTGADLLALSDAALPLRAEACDVFAEVEPNQKERLIGALRRAGHVVGYLGDGINDAPALHAADVGLSVQGAVDVAKEARPTSCCSNQTWRCLPPASARAVAPLPTRSSMCSWPAAPISGTWCRWRGPLCCCPSCPCCPSRSCSPTCSRICRR
jgi:Mg2+-importing ATPase